MDKLDLNIDNYNLQDIINLFKITDNFDDNDLKRARHVALMVHPDKSGLDPSYFIFYSKAYKVLKSVYDFKNTSNKKKLESVEDLFEDDKREALQSFFDKNQKLKDPKDFNKWFNKQFDQNKLENESEQTGYGDWLKSNEDIDNSGKAISLSQMNSEIEKKKKQVQSLVVHKDIRDLYYNGGISASSLTNNAPEDYSSDLFSNLTYQDLRQAHRESVIPVTHEDFQKVKQFNSVNEFMLHRDTQDTKPLSERQALEFLQNRENKDKNEGSRRAYELARQTEEAASKNKDFWGKIMQLKNN